MPIRKIAEIGSEPCIHPDHNPGHLDLDPGYYEYTCPGCNQVRIITIGRRAKW